MGTEDKNIQKPIEIGSIIYVLSENAQKIVPAVVVEEITIKKLDSNQISWKISVGPKGKEKIIDSSHINGELYTSLDEVKEVLEKRLLTFLNQMITDAEERALKWYGQTSSLKKEDANTDDGQKIDPENLLSSFDEPLQQGTQKTNSKTSNKSLTREQLREQLRKNLSDPEELLNTGEGTGMVELDDGTLVKAKIKFNEHG